MQTCLGKQMRQFSDPVEFVPVRFSMLKITIHIKTPLQPVHCKGVLFRKEYHEGLGAIRIFA